MSLRQQIITAIASSLDLASAPVFSNFDAALSQQESPALILHWVDDDVEQVGMGDNHRLTVNLQAYARGSTADAVADALIDEAYAIITADRFFAGKVRKLRLGSASREAAIEGGSGVLITQTILIDYITNRDSLNA